MLLLKQSTAVDIRVGPFVDATDGVTPETGITLGAADQAEVLRADGAATLDISGATWAAVTGADGWYDLTLSTTATNTLGDLTVVVQDTDTCLPVFVRAMVVPANVYDSLVAGTDQLETDLIQWRGTQPANLISTNVPADVAAVQTGAITAGAIAADAIGASELAADAVTEIVNGLRDLVVETEGSYTVQQVLSVMFAVLAGQTTSGGNTLQTPNGNATRVAATTNASNERTAMTITPSSTS